MISIHTVGVLVTAMMVIGAAQAGTAEDKPFGLDQRVPWTTSHMVGSPDPPLPYTVEPVFTNIAWKAPIYLTAEPATDSLLVVLQGGEKDRPSKVLRLQDDLTTDRAETLLEIGGRLIYSVGFHPGYATNGQMFVFSNGPTGAAERTNRISRFTVEREAPHGCDPNSEKVILEWHSSGHDGGGLVFGRDGMLYVSTGDGTSDSDGWVTGQDLSDLNGGILRIDVDYPDPGRTYSVPRDNPFLKLAGARPELWAYGLRNPWRMAVDAKTGQIWAGNNGQDLWETAHLIRRGENYGWSVYEGNHPFYLNRPRGPTPFVPPTIEHSHSEFRSLTGGVVYYGPRFPELNGVYIYGDYSTGRIWGGRHDGTRLTWHRELADTALQIVAFAVSHHGELLMADLGGGINRLVTAPKETEHPPFPTRLSETGLFASVPDHRVQPGLIPYDVNAPGWVDGAEVDRYMGVPGETRVGYTSSGSWNFPDGTVLMQTLSLAGDPAQPNSRRRLETRLLTRQQGEWTGYSYRWNESQTDATLVGAAGEDAELKLPKPETGAGGIRKWRFPSRAECLACHARAATFVLGLTELQMNRDRDYGGIRDNQLRALQHVGLFTGAPSSPPSARPHLVDPYDSAQDLNARARSYLQANCSVCHVEAGGGNSKMELGFTTAPERMNVLSARPQHDTFGINNAMLIAPGDPDRSVLYQRLTRRGRGQMPPLVSAVVDSGAARLIHDWIQSMKSDLKFVRDWKMEDLLPSLGELASGRSFDSGQAAFRNAGCVQCHRFAGAGGSVGPDLTGVGRRLSAPQLLESILLPSKVIAPEYAQTEIETVSGESITGRIEREDDQAIVFRPLTPFEEPPTVRKADVRGRRVSPLSNMPSGIVNSLEKAQVLDLLAYLIADGQRDRPAFR
jgi:uncharacterized repeat protein (TIGR03806 family)